MSSLVNATNCLKDAIRSDSEDNHLKAIANYSCALGHFASSVLNDKITIPELKTEVENQIEFCMSRLKTTVASQKQKEHDETDFVSSDIETIERSMPSPLLKQNIKFNDLCGMDTIKRDLNLALMMSMERPKVYSRGIRPYKGFLFFGPPGTGKSSIAQAAAGEAGNIIFFYITASDILSKYIGESEAHIRNVFEIARTKKPSIIFLNEIDALATKRTLKPNYLFKWTDLLASMTESLLWHQRTAVCFGSRVEVP